MAMLALMIVNDHSVRYMVKSNIGLHYVLYYIAAIPPIFYLRKNPDKKIICALSLLLFFRVFDMVYFALFFVVRYALWQEIDIKPWLRRVVSAISGLAGVICIATTVLAITVSIMGTITAYEPVSNATETKVLVKKHFSTDNHVVVYFEEELIGKSLYISRIVYSMHGVDTECQWDNGHDAIIGGKTINVYFSKVIRK